MLVMHVQEHDSGGLLSSFEPRCTARPGIRVGRMPFALWWEGDPILVVTTDHTDINRLDVVSFVANQDGGSHVDPALDRVYHALSRGAALGWTVSTPEGDRQFDDPTPASLRQITEEFLATLKEGRQLSPFARETTFYPMYPGDGRGPGGLRP
jgi:hypothetical protein